jgi:hypothetical protein
VARGGLPVGGRQAAVHRRRDLAVKGLFRAGATPREELGRAVDSAGRQGGRLHRRASLKRAARSPATWLRRALDLIHSTTAVLDQVASVDRCRAVSQGNSLLAAGYVRLVA